MVTEILSDEGSIGGSVSRPGPRLGETRYPGPKGSTGPESTHLLQSRPHMEDRHDRQVHQEPGT